MQITQNPSLVLDKKGRLVKVDDTLKHIAFIMDGNGRWAAARGKKRDGGHSEGAKSFERIVEYCGKIGLSVITFYAFSTENWKRPKDEVDKIFSLLERYIDRTLQKMTKNESDIKVVFIGDRSPLSANLMVKMSKLESSTANNSRILNIAINYGGRAEITHAVNKLISKGKSHVTENDIEKYLYTKDSPQPDLIIRTAGEKRLSNFLLWQSAYSEFYFTETLWPDFSPNDLEIAILDFYNRTRRFGGLK